MIFCKATWTEEQYLTFEQSILDLADEYFPLEQDLHKRKINKRASTTCPGGNGKFGFNSYR